MKNMNKVIVINGMAASGKSTFVSLCKEIDTRVTELSTVDWVKKVARFAGWDGVKDEKGRLFLSDLKDCMEKYDDIPNKKVCEIIDRSSNGIFFVNAREAKNIAYYKARYNAITVLITNYRVPMITSNHADANVWNYSYDFYIQNDGSLDELKEKAKNFMEMINNKRGD